MAGRRLVGPAVANHARPFLTLVPDRVINWLKEPGADPNDVVRKLREWGAPVQ